MLESYVSSSLNYYDLNLYQCGIEDCSPGYSYGPAVRDHYLIHFILKGKGVFRVSQTEYSLCKGQGFLICPYEVASYSSDMDSPWSYAWVGFNGKKAMEFLKAADLTLEKPIFTCDNFEFFTNCFNSMIACKSLKKGRDSRMHGYLYILLSQLLEEGNGSPYYDENERANEMYVRLATEYISKNFSRKITIQEISSYIGIDRGYLSKLFKSKLNISPQEYIINFRISKAIELLAVPTLSLGDISRSVGYDDPLAFSKLFKKVKGLSPKAYRNI